MSASASTDAFHRQRAVRNFNHEGVASARCLVLGTGGVGSTVAMGLARLGVARIALLDFDTVDVTNLNRQILFGPGDVGRRKVDAAADSLRSTHIVGSTELVTLDANAVEEWGRVVALMRDSTVVFNAIDRGAAFDYAVNSACIALGIPYLAASTYANTAQVEMYTGRPCLRCSTSPAESFSLKLESLSAWAAAHGVREDGWAAEDILAAVADLMQMRGVDEPVRRALQPMTSSSPDAAAATAAAPAVPRCVSTLEVKSLVAGPVRAFVEEELGPRRVLSHTGIPFCPKDRSIPTDGVGSWVCVCVAGALMCVNAWAQSLCEGAHYPNWSELNLAEPGIVGFKVEPESECSVCAVAREPEA